MNGTRHSQTNGTPSSYQQNLSKQCGQSEMHSRFAALALQNKQQTQNGGGVQNKPQVRDFFFWFTLK